MPIQYTVLTMYLINRSHCIVRIVMPLSSGNDKYGLPLVCFGCRSNTTRYSNSSLLLFKTVIILFHLSILCISMLNFTQTSYFILLFIVYKIFLWNGVFTQNKYICLIYINETHINEMGMSNAFSINTFEYCK